MKYRKKPVIIEAMEWLGQDEVVDWVAENAMNRDIVVHYEEDKPSLDIVTLEGTHKATYGDFIIKGIQGELYPCKPDIFKETYEEII